VFRYCMAAAAFTPVSRTTEGDGTGNKFKKPKLRSCCF
jgi:hypothetical protein